MEILESHGAFMLQRKSTLSKYKHIPANNQGYFWQKQHTDITKLNQKLDKTQPRG